MFFRISSATFSFADGRSTTRNIHFLLYLRKNTSSISSRLFRALFSYALRTVVVVKAVGVLLAFIIYLIKKNGASVIGNVPLGRANSVRIGLLGWLVHVVVFEYEREEYEGKW